MAKRSISELLGKDADFLLGHTCKTISKESIHLPSNDMVDKVFVQSNRNTNVLRNLSAMFNTGRLAGTGFLSILPIDQGIEHSGGASFAKNPIYFDPENIIKLAMEGGCNAVATTYGVLAMMSRSYAHKIPFVVKVNHNELLTYPNKADQIMFGTVRDAWNLGAAAIGATIYFGSDNSTRQIVEVAKAFEEAHQLGMATILWCYTRNNAFKKDGVDYHVSADLTGQANHLGVTIQADIIKQKLAENNGGYKALNTGGSSYGKLDERIYTELTTNHPIDLCRYQVANCYMGRAGLISSGGESKGASDLADAVRTAVINKRAGGMGLISSGGESKGASDLADAVRTAVINKRAGGMGLISGRKAFQRPMDEGVEILQAIQDVYLDQTVTVA